MLVFFLLFQILATLQPGPEAAEAAGAAGPEVKKLDPAPGTAVVANRQLKITFDEAVRRGTGAIRIVNYDTDATVATYDIEKDYDRIQWEKQDTVVIRLQNVQEGGHYYISIDAGALYGVSTGAAFGGLGLDAAHRDDWHFSIKTIEIGSQVPAPGERNVDADGKITLGFALNGAAEVRKGSGLIQIKRSKDDSVFQLIQATSSAVQTSGNRVTVTLNRLEYGTDYYVLIDEGAFLDEAGNPFAGVSGKSAWTFVTEPQFDTVKPKAKSYTPANGGVLGKLDGSLVIEFDEPVYPGSGSLQIVKASGGTAFCAIPVQSSAVVFDQDKKTVTITPANSPCPKFENNTTYRLQIGNQAIRDATGNYFDGVTWTFTVRQDTEPPVIQSFSPQPNATGVPVSTSTLTVAFNEAVTVASGAQASLYPQSSPGNAIPLTLSVDAKDNKKVHLTLPAGKTLQAGTKYVVNIANGAIQDLAGNKFGGILNTYQWTFETARQGAVPTLTKAETNGSVIVLTFSLTLDSTKVPYAGNFYVTVNDTYRPVTKVEISGQEVRLTLQSGVLAGQTVKVSYTPDVNNPNRRIQSADGVEVAAFSNRQVTNTGTTTAPRPVSGSVSGRYVTLTFNKTLETVSANARSQFTVRWAGSVMSISSLSVSGSTLTLELTSAGSANGAVSVSYQPGSYPLKDKDGNAVQAFTNFYVSNANDRTPPRLVSAAASGNKIVLTYDEGLHPDQVPPTSSFSVLVNGSPVSVTAVSLSNQSVELTLASSLTNGQTVTLTYVPSIPYLADVSGNAAPALYNYTITVGSSGTAKVTGASLNGTTLTLYYSAALSDAVVPLAGQYYVRAGSTHIPVVSVSVSGTTVQLTLAYAAPSGQNVTVTFYNTGNVLKDALNQTVESFTEYPVTGSGTGGSIGLDYAELDGEGLRLKANAVTVASGRTISGKPAQKYTVQESKFTGAFEAIRSGATGGRPRVSFQVPSTETGAVVAVPAAAWVNAASRVSNGEFLVEYGPYQFVLPFQAIGNSKLTSASGGSLSGAELVIKVETVSASPISSAISRQGAVAVGTPAAFAVYLSVGGYETEMAELDTYVTRSISINAGALKPAEMVVVRYDQAAGEAVHVPTKVIQSGTRWTFQFQHKGNGDFAVAWKQNASFADMKTHWARSAVSLLAAKFIVDGRAGNRYEPQQAVTRADFAKFIARGLGLAGDRNEAAKYRDIGVNHAYAPYIGAASKAGIVQGGTDGRFRPNDPITREEMATMMLRAINYTNHQVSQSTAALSKFADRGQISSWARSGVAASVNAGIIKGVTATRFAPKKNATRAEAAVMIQRLLTYVEFLEK